MKWFTTFGPVEVEEQLLRLGRRGAELRPFSREAGVTHRSYSRPLQRVLTDFGAEHSFARAASHVREHYRIEVPIDAVRQHTLKHARAIVGQQPRQAPLAAQQVITQMDGSMIPIVEPGQGADARKGKQLLWREARLCCARDAKRVHPVYGATLGSVEVASALWAETARAAGMQAASKVHGVGDGAGWIMTQFSEQFGRQGAYLLDFYHVSEYLAAAALQVAQPGQHQQWRGRQQDRLLNNQWKKVLRSLEPHLESADAREAPVRAAHRYLSQRENHLDYAGAKAKGLPIGSGQIEGGHRHIVQQRLKLSGAWWKHTTAQSMLGLRVARANQLWDVYWSTAKN